MNSWNVQPGSKIHLFVEELIQERDALRAEIDQLRAAELDEEETELLKLKSQHEMEIEFMQQQLDALRAQLGAARAEIKRLEAAFREASSRAAKADDEFVIQMGPTVVRPAFEVDWDEFGDTPTEDTP